jgi:hypothetical protein
MARYLNLGVQIDAPPELLAAAGEVEELEVSRVGGSAVETPAVGSSVPEVSA